MKRSSSMQGLKFGLNPHQFKIGESKIDCLPIRVASRRSSLRVLPKQPPPEPKSQLDILKEQNTALRQENEQLRREIDCLQQRASLPAPRTEQKAPDYRDLVRNKFTSRTKNSRITTECETGLFSSKEISLDRSQTSILELYENYKVSNKLPQLADLKEITERFFSQYCENYTKIKALFECLNTNKRQAEYLKLSELIELYRVPLLYQKSPQTLFRELSKSKEKGKKKEKEKEQLCLQVLSPQQTVLRFQGLLQKLCRSNQMLRLLKQNDNVVRFISKIEGLKH